MIRQVQTDTLLQVNEEKPAPHFVDQTSKNEEHPADADKEVSPTDADPNTVPNAEDGVPIDLKSTLNAALLVPRVGTLLSICIEQGSSKRVHAVVKQVELVLCEAASNPHSVRSPNLTLIGGTTPIRCHPPPLHSRTRAERGGGFLMA